MVIGALSITLHVTDSQSLKEKRHVIRSLTAKLGRTFNVAVAEVDGLDSHQTVTLGIACVSNSARHADEMSQKVLGFVENEQGEAIITHTSFELVHV
jgi:uncharacterized protein YlxP (DUF503 family)